MADLCFQVRGYLGIDRPILSVTCYLEGALDVKAVRGQLLGGDVETPFAELGASERRLVDVRLADKGGDVAAGRQEWGRRKPWLSMYGAIEID